MRPAGAKSIPVRDLYCSMAVGSVAPLVVEGWQYFRRRSMSLRLVGESWSPCRERCITRIARAWSPRMEEGDC